MEMEVFDKIVVASGPFPNIHLPEYPGRDKFQGIMIHSAQVRQDNIFEGKRVLIVGGSFSAAEMVSSCTQSWCEGSLLVTKLHTTIKKSMDV